MKYLKSISTAILYLLINFAIFKGVGFIFYNSALQKNENFKSFINSNHHVPMIIWFILSFIVLWAIFKFIKKKSIIEYCNFSRISLKNVTLMVYIGIGGFIFNTALINISFIDRIFPEFDASLKYIYEGSFVIFAILSAVIIGPIYEEILFRGVIFNELRNNIPLPAAIIIQSIMYGILFFNIPLGLFCFVAALLYSFIYIKLKTLWSLIILEFVQTFSVLLSRRMGIEDAISDIGDIYIIPAFIISIIIIISGCYFVSKSNKVIHKQ